MKLLKWNNFISLYFLKLLKLNGKAQIIFMCIKGNNKFNLAERLSF